jgi:nitrogen fixation/metabolism regulation signal transduction histidine kinase
VPARVPRRFRRRLLLVLLACALLPLSGWGLLASRATERALALSLEQLDPLLERSQRSVRAAEPGLAEELQRARLHLAQAELLRRQLALRLPSLLLLAAVLSALLCAALALLLGIRLSRPIEQLAKGMARVGSGDLESPLPERPGPAADELELLVRSFNEMARELLAGRARLRASENLAAWREVAQRLAHELKNPLTAMRLALHRLGRSDGGQAERLAESSALLSEEVEVLLRLTEAFAQFARLPEPVLREVELARLLQDACALYQGAGPVPLQCRAAALSARGDADQLRRLFGNLVKNGLEASARGGAPLEVELLQRGPWAVVEVRDRGPGPGQARSGAELLRSLGSTKQGGSGLGLPIAQKIAHDHGGAVALLPREGGGAVARVELPVSGPGAVQGEAA